MLGREKAKILNTAILFFPGRSEVKKICLHCERPGFNPWIGKIPWRMEGQPTSISLPGEFHGQRSGASYCSWGRKESDVTERLLHTHTFLKCPN